MITNIPSTQPSAPNANHDGTVAVRDEPTTFSEAAIQVETDLFVCPPLTVTKGMEEQDRDGDDSNTNAKGSKHKVTSQSTNN